MPPLQYWFTGTALAALIALIASIAGLGFGWYRGAVTEMEAAKTKGELATQKERITRVKALLENALATGMTLLELHGGRDTPEIRNDADAWGRKTYALILAAYGVGEATLFLDSSGYVFLGGSDLQNWIDGRMRRITDLLRRTDLLSPQMDFDPAQFE